MAEELFDATPPRIVAVGDAFGDLEHLARAAVAGGAAAGAAVALTAADEAALAGADGPAVQAAMRVVARVAALQDAPCLVDVERAHIDACTYFRRADIFAAR